VLALLWLFGNSEDRGAVVATAIACLIGLTAAFALSLIATPRPFMDGPALNYLDHIRDRSFLSDHATLLFAIAFAFWVHRPASLPSLWVPALALALAVGWARVFLGAHKPRDIARAALVAALATAVTATRPPGWLPLGSRRVRTGCANGSPPGCGASRQVIVDREDGCHDASPHDPRRRSCRPRAWPFATELGRLMPREKPE